MNWLQRILLFVMSGLLSASVYYKGKRNGWFLDDQTTSQISQIIEPHIEVFRPEGAGPYKTILMFHGCGGDQEQQRYWAEVFKSWGYAGVYVDSYAGRNIDDHRASDSVCQGRELLGSERAADVYAALNWATKQSWVNQSSIALVGWSHGAWSIMDAFALRTKGRQANGLQGSFNVNFSLISDVVLFYPYCGIGSLTGSEGWLDSPDVLAIDVAEDTVVGSRICDKSFSWVELSGSSLQHEIFSGVDHAFDAEALSSKEKDRYLTPKQDGLIAIAKAKRVLYEFLR